MAFPGQKKPDSRATIRGPLLAPSLHSFPFETFPVGFSSPLRTAKPQKGREAVMPIQTFADIKARGDAEAPLTAEERNRRYSSFCALVVEDSVPHRMLLVQMLKRLGVMKIYEAADGSAGLDLVQMMRPDVVFCDVMMEPMNGFDLLRAIQDDPALSKLKTPVIMVSAMTGSGTVMKASVLESQAYISKPFRLNQLQRVMNRVIPEGRMGTAFTRERPDISAVA